MGNNFLKMINRRTSVLVLLILVFGFGSVFCRLSYLSLVKGEELGEKAVDQQLRDTTISAKRGSIYDRNGSTLATSASIYKVILAPAYFEKDEQREYVAEGLAAILGVDKGEVLELAKNSTSYYQTVKRQVETDEKDKILEFVSKISEKYPLLENVIVLEEDFKRYYPYGDFASAVIGFTGSDDQGLAGIEYQYDEYLTGTAGRTVSENNANGTTMPFEYEQKEDAVDGNSLVLTIDETIQHFLEKHLKEGIEEYEVVNGAVAICMDVNSGAILGMAVENSYDLNDPYTLTNPTAIKEIEKITNPEAKEEAINKALAAQWRNKAISDTYYPGSVFKIITASMALQENVVNDQTSFFCNGYYSPYEGVAPIGCWNTNGHGSQDFSGALCNSCNPAFMMIGQKVGYENFWKYYQAFGFNSTTGIDLPGEATGLFFNSDGSMGPTDLAIGSFGQGLTVTPIEMVTAASAIANGGKLVQPYLVSQILDADGNVVETTEPKVKRQVISEDVANKISSIMEKNATEGSAKNGYVVGYRVAGKTGTSEKIGQSRDENIKDYIASFCGFAPADNPQIALIVYFDTPTGEAYYGSQVAAPVFASIMSEICPYLGIETQYTEEELEYVDTVTGSYLSMDAQAAKAAAEEDGFRAHIYGDGDTVLAQVPQSGSKIPRGGRVVLYTTSESVKQTVTVPDFIGYTISEVNEIAAENKINISFAGSVSSDAIYCYSQSIDPNTKVSPGTVVTVYFGNSNDDAVM